MHEKKKLNIWSILSPIKRTGNSLAETAAVSNIVIRKRINDIIFLLAGVFAAGLGLRGFLMPNGFLDGGATGISLLINRITGIDVSLILVLINAPFVLLGSSLISRPFALKTGLAIAALAVLVAFFPYPHITNDKLLIAVFGGFFLGAGIGLAVRGGAVIDGTEVLAIAVSKKTGLTIGDVILLVNVIIFSLAAWLVSIETAMYAMLTYLAASKTVDFIIEGIEEYMAVTIISVEPDKIRSMVISTMGRGITVYKGEQGYGKTGEKNYDMKILYTVVTRLELNKLKLEIEKIDPKAFVVMHGIRDMKGGMIKKRPLK
jgi:hypothetical protein